MKVFKSHQTLVISSLTAAFALNALVPAWAENWYPSSSAPYPGTAFHCNLTPLPPGLPGIKPEDREYIDHVYAVILKCAQEKELALKAINSHQAKNGIQHYKTEVEAQLARLHKLKIPTGLETFQKDTESAIELQMRFFVKAAVASANGADMNSILQIPEGHQASQQLFAAWDEMQKRYWFDWVLGNATKDSIYHHLCALDLF